VNFFQIEIEDDLCLLEHVEVRFLLHDLRDKFQNVQLHDSQINLPRAEQVDVVEGSVG
jgi:hypothetical protein